MTTERGSYDDPGGVDAIVATREDQLTGTGLDDSAPATGAETASGHGSSVGTPSTSDSGGDRLQDAAGSVADRVASTAQDKVGTQVDTGLTKAGDVLQQVAGAVRNSGDQLRDQQPQIASFADTAAGQVDRFATYLRDANAQDVIREAEGFARRQPAIFLGGALALGLIASRFLKASPQGGGSTRDPYRYGSSAASRYGDAGSIGRYGGGAHSSGYGGGTGYAAGSGTSLGTGYAAGSGYAGADTGTREQGVEHGGT